ncbi:hypothetical protein BJ138DRAFT_1143577, partial [Hygrophoropsis aurantiaca]
MVSVWPRPRPRRRLHYHILSFFSHLSLAHRLWTVKLQGFLIRLEVKRSWDFGTTFVIASVHRNLDYLLPIVALGSPRHPLRSHPADRCDNPMHSSALSSGIQI